MRESEIYLDYAATAPMVSEARAAMTQALDEFYGNASALHTPGHRAKEAIEAARRAVAALIGAEAGEVLFTSGGSEANNMVLQSFAGRPAVVSAVEHPSVLEAARAAAGELVEIGVDERGQLLLEELQAAVSELRGEKSAAEIEAELTRRATVEDFTGVVSVMLANNETGALQPVREVIEAAHRAGFLVHCDATQALGKIPIEVRELGVDYLTVSAHKIGGPVGVGALFVRKGAPIKPLIRGGHQEHGLRAGTYNVPAIVGFGAAARVAVTEETWKKYDTRVRKLRDFLAAEILAKVPHSSLNTDLDNSLPNILNASFAAAEGESIQLYLDAEGIVVSTGSACASGDGKPSHVLMAMAGDAEVAHSSVRFSLGLATTRAELERTVEVLAETVRRLQGMSTIKIKEAK